MNRPSLLMITPAQPPQQAGEPGRRLGHSPPPGAGGYQQHSPRTRGGTARADQMLRRAVEIFQRIGAVGAGRELAAPTGAGPPA